MVARRSTVGLADVFGGVGCADCASVASPTKRKPLRGKVRIRRCASPLSPTALRAALIRLFKVDSETIRPPHSESSRSSLVTTRSRFRIRCTNRSKTCGSSAIASPFRRSSRRATSNTWSVKRNSIRTPLGPSRAIITRFSRANQARPQVFPQRCRHPCEAEGEEDLTREGPGHRRLAVICSPNMEDAPRCKSMRLTRPGQR